MSRMISNRPYMIRATYEWIVDNGWTPHFQVDAEYPGIQIPFKYAQDGVIILNVSPTAVVGLEMQNDRIRFRARFQGQEQDVYFPPEAVLAVFARENGQGMPFPPEPYPDEVQQAGEEVETLSSASLKPVDGGRRSEQDADKTSKPSKSSRTLQGEKKKPAFTVVK